MASLGELVLKLTAELGTYSSDLKKAGGQAKELSATINTASERSAKSFLKLSTVANALGGVVAKAAAQATESIKQLAFEAIALGATLDSASKRTGASVEALGRLKFAGEQASVPFNTLERALVKVSVSAGAALRDPTSKAAQGFRELGIAVDALANQSPDQIFAAVADGVQRIADPLDRTAALNAVFGRSFAELLPLLSQGSEGLAAAAKRAEELGNVLSAEAAAGSDKLGSQFAELRAAAVGLGAALVETFGPVTIALLETAAGLVVALKDAFVFLAESVSNATSAISNGARDLLGFLDLLQGVQDAQVTSGPASNVAEFLREAEAVARSTFAIVANKVAKESAANEAKNLAAQTAAQTAAEQAAEKATRAAADAEQKRTDGLNDAREAQAAFAATQKASDASGRAFISSILQSTDAITKRTAAYERDVARAKESGDFNVRISAALRVLKKDYETETFAIRQRAEELARQPLERELANIQALSAARQEGVRAYQIELLVQRELSNIRANSVGELERETAALRARAAVLVDAENALRAQQRGAPSGLSDAFNRALGDGLEELSFSEFFDNFIEEFNAAFKENPLQVTADVLGLAATVAEAFRGSSSDAARNITNLLAQSQIPIVSQVAQAASAIDSIFGGRLFGTNFTQTGSGLTANFSGSGFSGQTQTLLERERSFFGGTQRRTDNAALGASEAAALNEFFDALRASVADGARLLSVQVPALITGAFKEVRDKDGRITRQISEVAGRIFREGFEDFQRRISAENIIALVGQSASEATNIAERWRASATQLLDGAQLLLRAQTDISNGVGLLANSGLADVAGFVERLARPNEALSEAYVRLASNSAIVRNAIDSISTVAQQATPRFVEFASALVDALGGLENAGSIIARTLEEFFTPAERAAASAAAQARRVAETQAALTAALGADAVLPIPVLLTRALAGAFSAEAAAAVFNYADAVAATREASREAAEAAAELVEREAELVRQRTESADALSALAANLDQQISALGDSDFSRAQRGIDQALESNIALAREYAAVLDISAESTDAYVSAQRLANAQLTQLQRDTQQTILRGLISLYEQAEAQVESGGTPIQNFSIAANQTERWRESLERLERESATLGIARNIRDLFDSLGQDTLTGLQELDVPIAQFLRDLGLNFSTFTNETAVRFGTVARELGVTLEDLAGLAGLDLDSLTTEQREAAERARAAQDAITKQQSDIAELRDVAKTAEERRAAQAETQIATLQELAFLTAQSLNELAGLREANALLAERLARAETRQAVGV